MQNKTKIISLFIIFILLISFISLFVFPYFKSKANIDLEIVKVNISKENFDLIKAKRKEALDLGILMSSKADYVKAGFVSGNDSSKAKLRLKGDWTDHLAHEKKWSFRVKVGGGMTFHGMRKFSLQLPITRNYIYEWVFHKMQKEMGLVSLRYEFVNLILNVDGKEENFGIYVIEEAFDKRTIENNERRAGVILKFDETALWEDRIYARQNDTADRSFQEMYLESPITSFNKNKVRKDSTLQMQFRAGASLLGKYRSKELASNQVFDLEKVAKYLALVNLLGAEHSVIWHNLRFYYNPITDLLEPIGFDAHGGKKIDFVIKYHIMGNDSNLLPYFHKELNRVISDTFLTNFKHKHQTEMYKILDQLNTEYDVKFDEEIIDHNKNTIRKYLKEKDLNINEKKVNSSNLKNSEALKELAKHDFINIDLLKNTINFKSGDWSLSQSAYIPKGFEVIAYEGFNLDLKNGAEIISESAFNFKGNIENPIRITSTTGNGDGILLKNCKKKSFFEYVEFINLSNPKNDHWSITGAVTIYKSDVDLKNILFIGNRSEDALNVFDAAFTMEKCQFTNTYSDAFDGDFVSGTLNKCSFSNLGNDAIDISGSKIFIENIYISSASDKCISAGERSEINGKNLVLNNSELAITSKDLSNVYLSSLEIDSCKVGFTAFQKKSEYDRATISVTETKVSNTLLLHLIEENSLLSINGESMPISANVKDRLYGKEFGKSSK